MKNNREKMLAYLDGLASNDDLVKLCTILRNGKDAERLTIAALNAFVPVDAPEPEVIPTPPDRRNINPGWTACTRIGGITRDTIHSVLNLGSCGLKGLQNAINRNELDTCALLQLLWDRGEIKYDGQEFWK